MLRIHILQNLYNLADEVTACEIIDSRAFSEFCGVESSNEVPDGDTIGRFRKILQKKELLLKKGHHSGLHIHRSPFLNQKQREAP
jgi:IS5 family transposase